MGEVVVRSLLQKIPVYCHPCSGVHEFSVDNLERILYALQAEVEDGAGPTRDEPCFEEALRWANDVEVYYEHVNATVEIRLRRGGIDCPDHDPHEGSHHVPECCYYEEDE